MIITEFKNEASSSIVSTPQSVYFIGESYIENINFDRLINFFLDVESQMCTDLCKDLNYNGPMIWGLRPDNIISKNFYNFFRLEHPETSIILEELKKKYFEFLKKINCDLIDSYLDCGINIMRKGERIPLHVHDTGPHSHITGTIVVKAKNTSTVFVHPSNQINEQRWIKHKVENVQGKITFFPSCLPHYVDIYEGIDERMLLSFDIISKKRDLKTIENYEYRLMNFM